MKTWMTATLQTRCGFNPDHLIALGDEYLELEINGTKRVRCRSCAPRYDVPSEAAAMETVEPRAEEEQPS